MPRQRFKLSSRRPFLEMIFSLLPMGILAAAVIAFSFSLSRLDTKAEEEGRSQAEAALSRAVTVCYTIEGRYPPNLSYLRRHYGLLIDEERYIVHYVPLADNLPPDMWVQPRHF